MNIVVPNTKDRQAALSASAETNVEPVDTAAVHSSSSVSSSGSRGDSSKPTKSAPPVSIKRVKPAYVQTLRPESAQVLDDDVRLTYARTFFNAFNGFEMEDIGCKLAKYCVDDCVMTVKWIGEKGMSKLQCNAMQMLPLLQIGPTVAVNAPAAISHHCRNYCHSYNRQPLRAK
jgi:hypothetical protein